MYPVQFINNKYRIWYEQIVKNAQLQNRIRTKIEYFEYHHIIPKSLGGTNHKYNLVALTAREHFICHYLLPKFTCGNARHSMLSCLMLMKTKHYRQKEFYCNSKLYEAAKIEMSITKSEKMTGVPRGSMTEDHKKNIGNANRGRKRLDMIGDKNIAKRSEVREKIRNSSTTHRFVSGENPWNKGMKMGNEYSEKMSKINKGKKVVQNLDTGQRKMVSLDELNFYLQNNWVRGNMNPLGRTKNGI